MDIRIINDGQNQEGGITAANVRQLTRANALLIAQVNSSGDIVNPGGGGGGDGAINDGSNSTIKATVLSAATTAASASDKALVVQFADGTTREVGKVSVREITSGIGITGDVSTTPKAGSTWPVSIAGTINTAEQNKVGTHVSGGQIGITGDVNVTVEIGDVITIGKVTASIGISGDVSTTPKAGQTWPVSLASTVNTSEQLKIGVHVAGGIVGISGDITATNLDIRDLTITDKVTVGSITALIGISGDVSTTPKAGQTWPVSISATVNTAEQIKIGAHVASGQIGVTGDVSTIQRGAQGVAITGDGGVAATVRDYTNSNPLSVALTNASGDVYSPTPKEPICATIPFRITSAGTTVIAGPYNGRVIKVCAYDLQAESDTAQCMFASNASGSQMTPQWILNAREGVAKQVSPIGGGYIFKTLLNQSLVIENAGANFRGSVTFHTGDSF